MGPGGVGIAEGQARFGQRKEGIPVRDWAFVSKEERRTSARQIALPSPSVRAPRAGLRAEVEGNRARGLDFLREMSHLELDDGSRAH